MARQAGARKSADRKINGNLKQGAEIRLVIPFTRGTVFMSGDPPESVIHRRIPRSALFLHRLARKAFEEEDYAGLRTRIRMRTTSMKRNLMFFRLTVMSLVPATRKHFGA